MSIDTELARIKGAKADLQSWVEENGVTVPDGTLIDGLVELAKTVETGGDIGGRRYAFGIYAPASDSSSSQVHVAAFNDVYPLLGLGNPDEYQANNYVGMYWDVEYPNVIPESDYSPIYGQCILGCYSSAHYYYSSSSTGAITRSALMSNIIAMSPNNGLMLTSYVSVRFRAGRQYAWLIIEK